ncbi:MAG TPA: Ig-like domain-containing protein, partial [Opitutaceae bacterium]|nr:Ig-like domain-containing protein [Opitutaceae bacterium]
PPDGNYTACVTDGQRAHARGARLLASPWTPPPALKSNNNAIHGSLLPEHYADYVAHLNGFISTMAAAGAPLSVISLQNEPDFDPPDYEGCQWSAEQFRIFCRDFAGDIQAPVMMPESYAFKQPICDATLNDPAAAAHVAYVGGHLYGAVIRDYPLAHSLGKPTWMTEFLINNQTISSAISTAQQIIDCLNVGNMSAYIWWKCIGTANGLLDNASVPQPRGYVMAQFSRFARPGDFRIAITDNTSPLGITAFRDLASARFAIVAVNYGTVPITQEFSITGVTATAVTPWITSATQSLEAQTPLTVTAGTFSYTIPPTSIVTFAGLCTDATAPASPVVSTLTHATSDATPSLAGTAEPRSTVTVYDGATALATTTADAYGKCTLDVALPQGAHTLTTTSTDASGNTSAPSGPITLTVGWSRFSALSARAPVGTGDQSLIMGFVYAGGGKPTLVRGVGPGLLNAGAGLTAAQILADPRLTLHELQPAGFTEFATNDNWDGSDELRTHMHALGMGALEANSKDAALLVTPTRTVCTAQVSGVGNTTGIALAETYDADFQDSTRRLTALSIRNQVGTGNAQLIVGFVIEGNAPKTVLLRGIGPGLVPAVAESAVLANPTLQLNKLDPATGNWTVVGSNDDWGGAPTLATAMRAAGMGEIAPGSADAALLLDLAPGIYTAQLTGVGATTGIGLVEIYEAP